MDLTNLNKDRNKRTRSVDLSTMVYGKIPPQAKEFEEWVLGSVMMESEAYHRISETLTKESFYVEAHQRIYGAIENLAKANQPIDFRTVIEELRRTEDLDMVGGPYYVSKLTNSVFNTAPIEYYASIIHKKFALRELIRISGNTISEAYEDTSDYTEIVSTHEKELTILTSRSKNNFISNEEALIDGLKRIEELRHRDDHMTGIPSGFDEVDRLTHGWQNTDLIILAARPAVGKTALALQLARNAALSYKKTVVAFFSMEMSVGQLTDRNLSAESEIPLDLLRNGRLSDEQMKWLYEKGVQKMANAKIQWDDSAALNIHELRGRCRRLKRKYNVGLIIVDYLQLMSGDGSKKIREQEISEISRGLKQVAKELKVPVIALSQLSRKTEERKGDAKMPQLSDLRESGAIEQDADMVVFMYRPEYYDINTDEMGNSNKGETHLRFAKHRNGSLETVKLRANLSIQKFHNWDGVQDLKDLLPKGNWKPVNAENNHDDNPF